MHPCRIQLHERQTDTGRAAGTRARQARPAHPIQNRATHQPCTALDPRHAHSAYANMARGAPANHASPGYQAVQQVVPGRRTCSMSAASPSSQPPSMHERATNTLSKLVSASDQQALASQLANSGELDESFFMVANAYLSMAQKDGQVEVAGRVEGAMRAAWQAQQAGMHPALRLLNTLVNTRDAGARAKLLADADTAEILAEPDRYFFKCLERFHGDVKRQPASSNRDDLLALIADVSMDTEAVAAATRNKTADLSQIPTAESASEAEHKENVGKAIVDAAREASKKVLDGAVEGVGSGAASGVADGVSGSVGDGHAVGKGAGGQGKGFGGARKGSAPKGKGFG